MLAVLVHIFVSLAAAKGIKPGQIKRLLTFGDSFTDVPNSSNGGTAWPVYAAGYANTSLSPFARSGATCSNNITFRPFPSLFESQLPLYFSQVSNGSLQVDQRSALYTLWIGTNDVGANALLTGGRINSATIVETTECAVNWVKTLYDFGARNFLFQNMIPLQFIPMYAADAYSTRYWTQPKNSTEWSLFMEELVRSGNAIAKLLLKSLAPSLPGAHVGLFDSYELFSDILNEPATFLNGTAPPNVHDSIRSCIFEEGQPTNTPGNCTIVESKSDRDSYLWFDELHPSEQADRVVAREVANVIAGKRNQYTTWFS